jgi:hypothetical protein
VNNEKRLAEFCRLGLFAAGRGVSDPGSATHGFSARAQTAAPRSERVCSAVGRSEERSPRPALAPYASTAGGDGVGLLLMCFPPGAEPLPVGGLRPS